MKSTQAMRDRIRELMTEPQDDYDRAVECVLDDLESILDERPSLAVSRPHHEPTPSKTGE